MAGLAALAAALMLVVTACSSSGGGSDADSPGGTPIVVGAMCSCTAQMTGGAFSLQPQVIQAWVDHTNAGGGINGHPVKVIELDDAGNPATALQNAKKLVQQYKVPAILFTEVLPSAAAYLKSTETPLIGFDLTFGPYSFPSLFTVGADEWTASVAVGDIAKRAGKQKFGYMYCNPGCEQPHAMAKASAEKLGIGYFGVPISLSQPDYVAQCLAAKSAGADALEIGSNGNGVSKVAGQCASQQYNPMLIGGAFVATKKVLNDPVLNGEKLWSSYANYQGDSTPPGAKVFSDAMQKYAGAAFNDPEFTPQYELAWAAGQMFKAAAEAGKIKPGATADDMRRGLYALKNETLGGLIAPTTYEPGKFFRTPCYYEFTIDSGKLTGGDKPNCVDQSVLDAITG
ncbi:ABC transporter substrate-binding protein [Nocardia aurantia]|uniref:ABC transporter substrate-binding protein n=1 Tax=Nocardia aurantia TaxID=2585199 RepID=UPI00129667AC|nr:ABC transporter substrate-binding protein [Nocardia aurantia]